MYQVFVTKLGNKAVNQAFMSNQRIECILFYTVFTVDVVFLCE